MKVIENFLNRHFRLNLQNRLILGFVIATCLTGVVSTIVGINILSRNTIDEVQRRIQQDIHTAQLIYDYNIERLKLQIQWIALRVPVTDLINSPNHRALKNLRTLIREEKKRSEAYANLDMLSLIDANGRVVLRVANPGIRGDKLSIEEVFLNLFINVADAMGGRGKLAIVTKFSSADNAVKIYV